MKKLRKGNSLYRQLESCLPSPQENLCEISMLQYQNQCKDYNCSKQFQKSHYNKFDGWVKVQHKQQTKSTKQVSPIKSNVEKYIKIASPIYKNFLSRRTPSKMLDKRPNSQRKSSDQYLQIKRSHSYQLGRKNPSQIFKKQINKTLSKENVRSKSASMSKNQFSITNKTPLNQSNGQNKKKISKFIQKVSVQSVSYPVFITKSQEKHLIPHIGRVRHLINIKGRLKL